MRKLLLLLLGLILISILSYLAFKTKGVKIAKQRNKTEVYLIMQEKESLNPNKKNMMPPTIEKEQIHSQNKFVSIKENDKKIIPFELPPLKIKKTKEAMPSPTNRLVDLNTSHKIRTEQNLSCQIKLSILLNKQQIEFTSNQSHIKTRSYTLLDKLFLIIKECENKKIVISGHTDSDGGKHYNQKLSLQRANAVKKYFIKKGIQSQQIESIGYGESNPIANNQSKEGKQKNRRIEIFIKGNKS